MSAEEFDEEFQELTNQFEKEFTDPKGIGLFELAVTLQSITEVGTYLSELLALGVTISNESLLELSEDCIALIPHLRRVADALGEELHNLLCDSCNSHEEDCECNECQNHRPENN